MRWRAGLCNSTQSVPGEHELTRCPPLIARSHPSSPAPSLLLLAGELALQVAIVQYGGQAFSTVPLSPEQWAFCAAVGSSTLLVRELLRRLPFGTWWWERGADPDSPRRYLH